MATAKKMFNRGIAKNAAFCNRVEETATIVSNIENLTHTLLISPRRYGKTSLALHAIGKSKLPYAHLDLFMKYEHQDVLNVFYEAVGQLLTHIMKPTTKAMQTLESLLKNIKVSINLGQMGMSFSLKPETNDHSDPLKSLLLNLDRVLEKQDKTAIIFIDEMQAISEMAFRDELEATLRYVAQHSQHLCFIFSGSHRHLLSQIFEERSRPFYKLCHIMPVERIASTHYIPFINKFAEQRWKDKLSTQAMQRIFQYTQCHSYYVNILCEKLFRSDNVPTVDDIHEAWRLICSEEQSSIARDIMSLSIKQKQLLREIARHPQLKNPTANEFVKTVDLTPRGITNALDKFKQQDLIEVTSGGIIQIVDPVLEYWCRNIN